MKQEFISSNGKVIIERDRLYFRDFKTPLDQTAIGKSIFPLIILVLFIFSLLRDDPSGKVGVVIWGVAFLLRLPDLYEVFIKRSYASRIPLSRIVNVETEPDNVGLETCLKLHLKSGRYRLIHFRTLEKQLEPLADLLSQRIAQPDLA